ncbi:integrase, partial [Chryseobacterium sp. HMWF028]
MLKTKFFVRQKSGEVITPIYVRVSNGRAFDLKAVTKETCIASHWDCDNGMMKERFFIEQKGKLVEKRDGKARALFVENRKINERLQDLSKKIDKAFKEAEGVRFTTEWLKAVINPPVVVENSVPDDFVSFCPVFIEQKKHEVSKGYIIKVNGLKRIISEFLKHVKKKTLKFGEINLKFKVEFEKYCYEVMGYSVNYTFNNLRLLRII